MLNFHAFTAKHAGRVSAILTKVQVFPAFDPANPPQPEPHCLELQALWDTGATGSLIAPEAAQKLGLEAVGRKEIQHAGGQGASPVYLVNVRLPNAVGVQGVEAVGFASPLHFDFIIGMNIITQGDFSVTNVDGKTSVSFRIPSCEEIDYVVEANRLRFAGVKRNAPCPCGSGKKFKHCHGGPNPPP